jgi:hypothetical protein
MRTSATLVAKLEHDLAAYTTLASSASLAVVALVQPTGAEVIYTPAHVRIGQNVTIPIDLNNDGKADFSMHQSFTLTSYVEAVAGTLGAVPQRPANQIAGYVGHSIYASAFAAGVHIGPKKNFFEGVRKFWLSADTPWVFPVLPGVSGHGSTSSITTSDSSLSSTRKYTSVGRG